MRILGIDYGDVRTGLSISDSLEMMAGSPSVIKEYTEEKLVDRLCDLIAAEKIGEIVLGFPKHMNGDEGIRAQKSQSLKAALEARTGLTVVLWDERQTTVSAHRILSEVGARGKKRKETVDAVAASLILQNYLDFKAIQRR